jgi:hypothetical protein
MDGQCHRFDRFSSLGQFADRDIAFGRTRRSWRPYKVLIKREKRFYSGIISSFDYFVISLAVSQTRLDHLRFPQVPQQRRLVLSEGWVPPVRTFDHEEARLRRAA